jgi:hypothetical protein
MATTDRADGGAGKQPGATSPASQGGAPAAAPPPDKGNAQGKDRDKCSPKDDDCHDPDSDGNPHDDDLPWWAALLRAL